MNKVLDHYEELKCVIYAKKGDKTALEKLYQAYLPLLKKSAGKIQNLKQDAFSASCEAFVLAVKNFDPNREIPFAAYLARMVKCAAHDVYRKEMRFNEKHFLPSEENNPIDFAECKINPINAYENSADILKAMNILTAREKEVIIALYFLGLNGGETAQKLNLSPKTVSNAKIRAIKKMREYLYTIGYNE